MSEFLQNENAYSILGDCIVSPVAPQAAVSASPYAEMVHIKRSYRAMKILEQDASIAAQIQTAGKDVDELAEANNLILDTARAGLLAKKLFRAYSQKEIQEGDQDKSNLPPHIPHVNYLLNSLLKGYASSIVSAACAGGKDGIETNLGPMLSYRSVLGGKTGEHNGDHRGGSAALESPLPVLAAIVTTGCTGKFAQVGSERQQPPANAMMGGAQPQTDSAHISQGHRRKFVKSLADWDLLTNLADCIDHPGTDEDALYRSEAACDALLNIVDRVGYPITPTPPGVTVPAVVPRKKKEMHQSVGEEALLATLASDRLIHHLTSCITDGSLNNSMSASRALLGLFDLATGRSKTHSAPPSLDGADADEAAAEAAEKLESERTLVNKLRKCGITSLMHKRLVANVELLVRGMDVESLIDGGSIDTRRDRPGTALTLDEEGAVKHPGHYIIKRPFTARRLNLLTLLADILDYDETGDANGSANIERASNGGGGTTGTDQYGASRVAIDAITDLSLPPRLNKNGGPTEKEGEERENNIVYNPFPGLVDLIFAYPENNMFQIQFYRLFRTLCVTNHERALKVVVQRSKFVARAIRGILGDATLSSRGVLLRCLNALRLLSQSLPPSSFVRHYLDSHDGWKGFLDQLRSTTVEQQREGGGIPLPHQREFGGVGPAGGLEAAIRANPLVEEGGGPPATSARGRQDCRSTSTWEARMRPNWASRASRPIQVGTGAILPAPAQRGGGRAVGIETRAGKAQARRRKRRKRRRRNKLSKQYASS